MRVPMNVAVESRGAAGWAALGFALALAALPCPAGAQESVPQGRAPGSTQGQDTRAQAYRGVAGSCALDYQRLCPDDQAQSSPSPRAQVLCLKFYKSDLSLGCRKAVNAALQR